MSEAAIDGKLVVSRLLPQDGEPFRARGEVGWDAWKNDLQLCFLALSTRYDGKTVITGCGIGRQDEDGHVMLSDVAQSALDAMGPYIKTKRLIFCMCRNPDTARQRAIASLKQAGDGDGLFIACENTEIVDAVFITETFGLTR